MDTTGVTLTQPRTDTKPGRLLETILDESTETATSSPAKEHHKMEASPQAVTSLTWSDGKFPPYSLRTSLFHETPAPEPGTSLARPSTILDYSDVKLTPNTAANESFHRSIVQPTPISVKKSLFEDSPQSQQMPVTPRHPVTQQTPISARAPLSMGPSPQLDFWLAPPDGNLDYSGVQATPISARTDLFEGTPLESGNSSFNGIEFLGRFGEQVTPETDQATSSAEATSQQQRSAMQATSVSVNNSLLRDRTPEQRAFNSEFKPVDTTELAERLNRIKQPSLGTSGLQHNTSIDPLSTKHTPAGTAGIGGRFSQHGSVTREMVFVPSDTYTTSKTRQLSNFRDLTPPNGTEQHETILTPSGMHPTPKPTAFFKETSFQNVSSSSYEVDTSALIQRLNKIKLTQQSFTTPHYTPSRPLESTESIPRSHNVAQTPSDTSLLASRLDQIKQAQKSQQV